MATITTKYDIRYLDKHGDAVDVWHHDTIKDAMDDVNGWTPGHGDHRVVAVVIERHDMIRARANDGWFDSEYRVMYTAGSVDALKAWGATDSEIGGAK